MTSLELIPLTPSLISTLMNQSILCFNHNIVGPETLEEEYGDPSLTKMTIVSFQSNKYFTDSHHDFVNRNS